MARINRSSRATCAAALAVFLMAVVGQVDAADKWIWWNDGGGDHNWTTADNWAPAWGGGPANDGYWEFLVTIGCHADPNLPVTVYNPVYFDALSPVEITDFFLCRDSRLVLNAGTDLTVLRTTEIDGIIDGQGGNFTAPRDPNFGSAAFPGNRARIWASDGSRVAICAPMYSSTGLVWPGHDYTATLMSATDPNTLIDLSCLTDLNAGFNDGDAVYDHTYHYITASGGSTINLSSVETITGPAQIDDRLEIEASDATSYVLLDAVDTITTASRGQVRLEAYDGAELELPSASSFVNTLFHASTGGSIVANVTPATYSSIPLIWPGHDYAATIVSATDPNTLIDLSAITDLNAGFDDGDTVYDHTYHYITASGGAKINMTSLLTLTGPVRSDDSLQLTVSGAGSVLDVSAITTITNAGSGDIEFTSSGAGSVLDMSALESITGVNGGEVPVDISDGAYVRMGNVSNAIVTTTFNIGEDSVLSIASLQACSPVAITLNGETARIEVDDFLRLGDDITITAPTGGTVSVGGDFRYTHENVADVNLRFAHVECVGDSQLMEIGGTNFGPSWGAIPDSNFGYEQLTIGEPNHATSVELIDLHDNHEPGEPDVLYLFGVKDVDGEGGVEGLRILGGSTLIIGDLDVYARLDLDGDGVIETEGNLRSLFGVGETIIPFDHNGNDGYISLTPVFCPADLWPPAGVDLGDLATLLGYYGTTCFAEPGHGDINGDGDVDLSDLAALLGRYGMPCP